MENSTADDHSTSLEMEKVSLIEQAFELAYRHGDGEFLVFESLGASANRRREVAIPINAASEIIEAIDRGAERTEGVEGWIDPLRGYAEYEVQQQGISPFRNPEKFEFEHHPCSHIHIGTPPVVRLEGSDLISSLIRVTSNDGSTCIEISPNSPLATPLLPVDLGGRQVRSQSTLKVFLGGEISRVELLSKSRALANSFLFELNARHRTPYSLRPKLDSPISRRHLREISYKVRFPRTPVPNNVAELFSIPNNFSTRGAYTLAYLSYYQVLEHYLPGAHRRETVRRVRRVLRSLDFDEEKDSSILQILNSVERSHGASEGDQLRTLIEESVPKDQLQDFFSLDHGGHFAKGGPISGVPAINTKSGEGLASQVAKRVYMLRNRIVHAKDDVRFVESSVLLPFGYEASKLYPDIDLLRLLAIEVIVSNR